MAERRSMVLVEHSPTSMIKFGSHTAHRLDTAHGPSQHLRTLYTMTSVSESRLINLTREKKLTQARLRAKVWGRARRGVTTTSDGFILFCREGETRKLKSNVDDNGRTPSF